MKKADLIECASIVTQILGFLSASVPFSAAVGASGAQINQDIGDLIANAQDEINTGTLPASLLAVFDDARACGVDLAHMSRVRDRISGLSPVSSAAVLLVETAVVFALVTESKIIAGMTFTARDTVEALLAQMQVEFDPAEEQAADRMDSAVYQAVISLHAAVTHHLVITAQPLPRIIRYTFADAFPSLVIAQRLYADGGRADEIRDQNHVIAPLFCPLSGVALSA